MAERDYYRAISVFKELAFLEPDAKLRARWKYRIGRAYRLSGRYELAAETLVPLLDEPALEPQLRLRAIHHLGLAYLAMQSPAQAIALFEEGRKPGTAPLADVLTGFIELDAGEPARAMPLFVASAARGTPAVRALALELHARAIAYDRAPTRSALAAGALSLVVPGAGQAYTGHWVDAAQAFAFVGAFGFMTFVAYRYEHEREGPYVLTSISGVITGIFHVANVVGAARSAEYYNLRHKQALVEEVRERVLGFDFE
jgi:hypothetical protein